MPFFHCVSLPLGSRFVIVFTALGTYMLLTLHIASFSLGHAGTKSNWLHPLLCKGQVSSRRSSFSFSMGFSRVFLAWLSGFLGCGCTLFHGFLNGCCLGLSAAVFAGFLCFFLNHGLESFRPWFSFSLC